MKSNKNWLTQHIRVGATIVFTAAIMVSYQNCGSDVMFSQMQAQKLDEAPINIGQPGPNPTITSSIKINEGALYTNDMNVKVTINSPQTISMIISNEPDCTGQWQNQTNVTQHLLKEENQKNTVYAKFKTSTNEQSSCVQASIIHDDINPTVKIVSGPAVQTNSNQAQFTFEGEDVGSGLSHLECKVDNSNYAKCDSTHLIGPLDDDTHTLIVRAVDRANNKSEPQSMDWLVDTTPPKVEITKGPQSPTNSGSATFEFKHDDFGGSGVIKYECTLSSSLGTSTQVECDSPKTFMNLGTSGKQVDYALSVVAVDKVGLKSSPATYSWTVNQVPAGDFTITGITSPPTDVILDAWLRGAQPTVNWTLSQGAVKYYVNILNENGLNVCSGTTTHTNLSLSNCSLTTNKTWKAKVVAETSVGITLEKSFDFITDYSAPAVQITNVSTNDETKNATIHFNVQDVAPGKIATTTCLIFSPATALTPVSKDCKNLSSVQYTGLADTEHMVKVVATDSAGNVGEASANFKIKTLVCDPFSSDLKRCDGGLVGELYYTTDPQATSILGSTSASATFNYLITHPSTKKINALVKLSQINVPTRDFTAGFPTSEGNTVKNDQGQTLVEYFGFKLNSVLKLAPNQAAGWYQLALLTDDGSNLYYKTSPTANYIKLIDNDGTHGTKLGCANQALYLDANSRIPIKVEYYQGPRHRIALTLVWRKVTNGTPPHETLCNHVSNSWYEQVNYPQPSDYMKLLSNGWSVPGPTNFVAPPTNIVE